MPAADHADQHRGALPPLFWIGLFAAFAIWTAWRLGAFDLWVTVTSIDGSSIRFPNTFATVDHPFHASRAETLRRSLADGEILRWIGNHQGGYPAEFYPLGAAWVEVLAWGLALGSLPMMAIHKLVVIGVYVLPFAGFAALARYGRLPWSVPVLAIVMHVAVRGWWWSGGYMELIEWGLLTNVASAALLPLVLAWQRGFLRSMSAVLLAGASTIAAIAMYTNVRSVLPLAAIVVGAAIAAAIDRQPGKLRGIGVASAAFIGLTTLLVAPLAIALVRFEDLYVFVRYSSYENLGEYWDSSVQAVSAPVLVLAIVGGLLAIVSRRDDSARTVVIVLGLYVAGTALTVLSEIAADTVSQLEATRLMPFQRLLVIYLAAYGTWAATELLMRRFRQPSPLFADVTMALVVLIFVAVYIQDWVPGIAASDQARGSIVTTGNAATAELQSRIEQADAEAPPGTAILVLGGSISWHDQLWAPQWSDRRFFYDDWLWYWQTDHVGDYDPLTSHAYADDTSTLNNAYLRQHGIGAVVVTGEAAGSAQVSPLLTQRAAGTWSYYLVNDPTPVLTAGGAGLLEPLLDNQRIEGSSASPQTSFEVRHNWYPRWEADIDGQEATITKDEAGYMVVEASEPGQQLTLTYRVDGWDWLGRVGFIVGVVLAAGLAVSRLRTKRFRGLREIRNRGQS